MKHAATSSILVTADSPDLQRRAAKIADTIGLPFVEDIGAWKPKADFLLMVTAKRVELREAASRGSPLFVDFVHGETAYRRVSGLSRKQPLARAIGVQGSRWTVVDATAGLGRDAFLLACMGCTVMAMERSPVLFALLQDGWERALQTADEKLAAIVRRITVVHADARDLLLRFEDDDRPDAVYVDPMFPPRKKSALEGKEIRLCRALVGGDEDAEELLKTARRTARRRVVVKRHRHAPPLAQPSFEIPGRSVRYDVYLTAESRS